MSDLGVFGRIALEAKLLGGGEATLTYDQSKYMVRRMKAETSAAYDKVSELNSVSHKVQTREKELSILVPEVESSLRATVREYKRSKKDPERRKRLAQRMIVQNRYKDYLAGSQKALDTTVQRIKDAIEDAQMVYDMSKQRAKDAEIYMELNGGIKLVGRAMMQTRLGQKMPEIEYGNLSTTLTALEEEITNTSSDQLLLEAERISKQ